MKPLVHPSMASVTVAGILHAFADPVRLEIYIQMAQQECGSACKQFLQIKRRKLAKSSLSQHLGVLRAAGLIHSTRDGVQVVNRTRCTELKERFGPLIKTIIDAHLAESGAGKRRKAKR